MMLNYSIVQMSFYTIVGIFFTLPLSFSAYMLVQKPIESLISMRSEVKAVREGRKILRFKYHFLNAGHFQNERIK